MTMQAYFLQKENRTLDEKAFPKEARLLDNLVQAEEDIIRYSELEHKHNSNCRDYLRLASLTAALTGGFVDLSRLDSSLLFLSTAPGVVTFFNCYLAFDSHRKARAAKKELKLAVKRHDDLENTPLRLSLEDKLASDKCSKPRDRTAPSVEFGKDDYKFYNAMVLLEKTWKGIRHERKKNSAIGFVAGGLAASSAALAAYFFNDQNFAAGSASGAFGVANIYALNRLFSKSKELFANQAYVKMCFHMMMSSSQYERIKPLYELLEGKPDFER